MLFFYGFGTKSKTLLSQPSVCKNCGRMCHTEIFLRYHYFSLFFIPLFKWNKKYIAHNSCCGATYTLSNEMGKDIKKGLITSIDNNDIEYVSGTSSTENNYCIHCGAVRDGSDYIYCPKCGHKY